MKKYFADSDLVLRVSNLSAGYGKNENVIDNISFEVGRGEMVGLLGMNGSGKSTLIKTIHGLLHKTQGRIYLPERDYAYIPEMPALYEELTLWEHLETAAMARGLERQDFIRQAERLLQQFDMVNVKDHFPGGFSKGTRQKVMVMCAMLGLPGLYLIDEPFNGLDALAIKEVLEWLYQEKQRGAGILLCTHVLETAQRICDRFIIISRGRIIAAGTLEQLIEKTGSTNRDLFAIFLRLREVDDQYAG